ncbi:MAG TPA: amidase family protein, partial [Reyranella sp.]|nr:amidase family protein [Reyranella sp.]
MRAGDIRAEAYARALLDRADATRHLNTLISLDRAQVMAAAHQADSGRARGVPTGALHGLPVLIKDNINTAALGTTAGTPSLAESRPKLDAEIVAKLLGAGGMVFAKANMHELAFGVTSNNPRFGAVRNPYDLQMIPGGSSGGNAAAVAARLTPAGVGTDTGGSTRIPAALCGIVGFRPTIGRYPGRTNADVVPISHTRDTPGPMAR